MNRIKASKWSLLCVAGMAALLLLIYRPHPYVADKVVYVWAGNEDEEIFSLGDTEMDVLRVGGRPVEVRFGEAALIAVLSASGSRPRGARLIERSKVMLWSIDPAAVEKRIGCVPPDAGLFTRAGGFANYKFLIRRLGQCTYMRYEEPNGDTAGTDVWGSAANVHSKMLK